MNTKETFTHADLVSHQYINQTACAVAIVGHFVPSQLAATLFAIDAVGSRVKPLVISSNRLSLRFLTPLSQPWERASTGRWRVIAAGLPRPSTVLLVLQEARGTPFA